MAVDMELTLKTKNAPGERSAGIVDSERRGLWAYYYVTPTHWRD